MTRSEQCSSTGDPGLFGPYQQIDSGVRSLVIDRIGISDHDFSLIQAGSAVVGIAFPGADSGLRFPLLVVAVRGGSDACVAAAQRLSTARFSLTWQTRTTESLTCELYVPAQTLHRQFDERVFRLFARMATSNYCGCEKSHGVFTPLERYRALQRLDVLYGNDGEYGEFSPDFRANSGSDLRYVRCSLPIDTIPTPV